MIEKHQSWCVVYVEADPAAPAAAVELKLDDGLGLQDVSKDDACRHKDDLLGNCIVGNSAFGGLLRQ